MLRSSFPAFDPGCVKTHTSPKCRKYNSQVRDRVACVQHDLALTMRNLFEMFYARRERSRFDTAKTTEKRLANGNADH